MRRLDEFQNMVMKLKDEHEKLWVEYNINDVQSYLDPKI